jgi:hypothetical protein
LRSLEQWSWGDPLRDPSLKQTLKVGISVACDYGVGWIDFAAHVELKHVGCCYDGFEMMAIFKECVSNRFSAINEQAAEEAVLFLGNPVSSAVLADKNQ